MSATGRTGTCVICEEGVVANIGHRVCASVECRKAYRRWLENRKPVCAICGRLLQTHRGGEPLCGSRDCQVRWTTLTLSGPGISLGRCVACGVFTSRLGELEAACRDPACGVYQAQLQHIRFSEARQQEFLRVLAAAESLRDRLAAEQDRPAGPDYRVSLVPHTSAAMGPPNAGFLRSFEEDLRAIVATAFGEPEAESDWPRKPGMMPNPTRENELPVFSAACTACRGYCCREGQNHAFLSVGIIRRYIGDFPDLTAGQVIDNYLERLPAESMTDSCVFHTDRGCNLPREMRSDVCNRFLCNALRDIRGQISEGAGSFFIVAEEEGTLFDARFADVAPGGET